MSNAIRGKYELGKKRREGADLVFHLRTSENERRGGSPRVSTTGRYLPSVLAPPTHRSTSASGARRPNQGLSCSTRALQIRSGETTSRPRMFFSYLIRVRVDRNIVIGSKPTSSSGQLSERRANCAVSTVIGWVKRPDEILFETV